MKWDMEIEEIEAVLEKIWELHDKLSDAIHSISRAHFLDSIKSLRKPEKNKSFGDAAAGDENGAGFVFIKDFRVDDGDSSIQEAKSLNSIRTALENLEDQLEFFHTVQVQQQTERDAAIARLEQSRIILSMRLAEHHGKKYKVIEEALAFVGDVHDATHSVAPENLNGAPVSNHKPQGKAFGIPMIKVLFSSCDFAKKFLTFDHMGGVLSNVALFTISMITMLQLHRVARKEPARKLVHSSSFPRYFSNSSMNPGRTSVLNIPSSQGTFSLLDVQLSRG